MNKPLASISLDLDNQWSYMKTHGDPGWRTFPSYLDIFIPYVLDILEQYDLKITFFIVGQDAALDKNREVLRLLTERGHEVANHSFKHEPWISTLRKDQIKEEIALAEEHIHRVTGQKPVGFRGPGFSWSPDLLEVLSELGYLYDASTLPTYIGPLARAYCFSKSRLTLQERQQRKDLFGSVKDGLRPVKPYLWKLSSSATLLELPVTTIPIVKMPFHLSYLIYLHQYSPVLMSLYLKCALSLCKVTHTDVSFLLHPLDLIGGDQISNLSFFPGMVVASAQKRELFERVLREIAESFTLVNMSVHARFILSQKTLGSYSPVAFQAKDVSR